MATSDDDLKVFLRTCPAEECLSIVKAMESTFSSKSKELCRKHMKASDIPGVETFSRDVLAFEMVDLIRWYGSDGLAYGIRNLMGYEAGATYAAILRDVVVLLNKRMAKTSRVSILKAVSVEELEEILIGIVLRLAFKGKSTKEIAATLEEAGLESDVAATVARKFAPGAAVGPILQVLLKALGKKTVMRVTEMIAIGLVGRIVSKDAATAMAKRLLSQIAQKALTRWIVIVGWALTAVDVAMLLSSPAHRITVPTVSLIAAYRVRTRMEQLAEVTSGEQVQPRHYFPPRKATV